MSAVEFRVGAEDPLAYACGLLRTAAAKGATLVVRVAAATIAEFDARLWTFSQLDFVPHCRDTDALATRTPIVLTDAHDLTVFSGRDCLVNLALTTMTGWEVMPRIIEIVGLSAEAKQAGRQRFRVYRLAGCELTTMEIHA